MTARDHTSTGAHVATAPGLDLLDALDAALLDVRRLGRRPGYRARLLSAIGDAVDVSTVRVLRAVERGDGSEAGVCVGDVAERLEVDPSTASRLVDQQVVDGYLTRTRSDQDRRRSALALTRSGRDLLAAATAARLDLLAEATDGWTVDELTTLLSSLDRLRAGFARFERSAGETGASP